MDSGVIPVDSYVIPVDSYVIPVDSGVIPVDSGIIPVDSGVIPAESDVIPNESCMFPVESCMIPVEACMTLVESCIMPVESCIIQADSGKIQESSIDLKDKSTNTSSDLLWPLIRSHQTKSNHVKVSQRRGPKVHLVRLPIARKKVTCKRQVQDLTKRFLDMAKLATNDLVGLLAEMLKKSGVIDEVLIACKIKQMSPLDPLHLRKALNLSNTMTRVLIRELKSAGVNVKSYYWIENQFKTIQDDFGNYHSEYVSLTINKEDPLSRKKGGQTVLTEERPLVYHTDIKKYVSRTLLMLHEKQMLILDKDGVSPNTLEVLWTGDKADSTYLFSFHIINVENSQSRDNARCVLMFEGPDTHENLKIVFDRSNLGKIL